MNGSFSNRWISVERIQIHEKRHEMGGLKTWSTIWNKGIQFIVKKTLSCILSMELKQKRLKLI
jgi:hypothetical protein